MKIKAWRAFSERPRFERGPVTSPCFGSPTIGCPTARRVCHIPPALRTPPQAKRQYNTLTLRRNVAGAFFTLCLHLVVATFILVSPADAQVSGISSSAFGARTWRECVATSSNLPTLNNRLCDIRSVRSPVPSLWIWTSANEWVELSGAGVGEQGPQGLQGDPGVEGPMGAQGPAGPVAGLDTQVIFNDASVAAGDSGFTFSKANDILTVAGAVALPSGSASLPSVRVGQPATGIWQPSANVLGFATNGVESLRLNSTSNGVNYVEITPQASGGGSANGPTIKGTGTDSSVDLNFDTKGTSGRFQWKINGFTKMDYTDVGGGAFALRNMSGPVTVPSGSFVGDSSNNSLLFANGGNWTEIKGNGVVGLRVSDTATTVYNRHVTAAQTVTIADNGNGTTRASATFVPTTGYIFETCNDPQGCDTTISESGAVDGQTLQIVCASANVCGFIDLAGVTEMAGNFDMGQNDTLTFLYAGDRFVEVARSNN